MRSSLDIPELSAIPNSPSKTKANLNHQRTGLASLNRNERINNMNQIATQPGITAVKWLLTAKTQIFNNWSDKKMKSLYMDGVLANSKKMMKIKEKEALKCLK